MQIKMYDEANHPNELEPMFTHIADTLLPEAVKRGASGTVIEGLLVTAVSVAHACFEVGKTKKISRWRNRIRMDRLRVELTGREPTPHVSAVAGAYLSKYHPAAVPDTAGGWDVTTQRAVQVHSVEPAKPVIYDDVNDTLWVERCLDETSSYLDQVVMGGGLLAVLSTGVLCNVERKMSWMGNCGAKGFTVSAASRGDFKMIRHAPVSGAYSSGYGIYGMFTDIPNKFGVHTRVFAELLYSERVGPLGHGKRFVSSMYRFPHHPDKLDGYLVISRPKKGASETLDIWSFRGAVATFAEKITAPDNPCRLPKLESRTPELYSVQYLGARPAPEDYAALAVPTDTRLSSTLSRVETAMFENRRWGHPVMITDNTKLRTSGGGFPSSFDTSHVAVALTVEHHLDYEAVAKNWLVLPVHGNPVHQWHDMVGAIFIPSDWTGTRTLELLKGPDLYQKDEKVVRSLVTKTRQHTTAAARLVLTKACEQAKKNSWW